MNITANMPPNREEKIPITSSTICQVLANHPDLSSNGFSFNDHGKPVPATDIEFLVMRIELPSAHRIQEIQTAYDYIRHFPLDDQKPVDNYALKHRIEWWGRAVGKSESISNGAVIVAAILCGYSIVREPNSPNCKFSEAS